MTGGRPLRRDGTAPPAPELWALHQTVQRLIERCAEPLPEAAVCGTWDGHDVLAHIVFWHRHYARLVRAQLATDRAPSLPTGTFRELNQRAVDELRDVPVPDLCARLARAQRELEKDAPAAAATRVSIQIKAGSKPWPWLEFLRRVDGHLRGHALQLGRPLDSHRVGVALAAGLLRKLAAGQQAGGRP